MKNKLMQHHCMDKGCGFKESSHKIRDGMKCPKCGGPIMSSYKNKIDPPGKKFCGV